MSIDYVDQITKSTLGLVELVKVTPKDMEVPTCPGWSLWDLLDHVAKVQKRAALRIGRSKDVEAQPDSPSSNLDEVISRSTSALEELTAGFGSAGDGAECWNWTGSNQTVGWMKRRQAQEVTIHHFDALLTSNPDEDVRVLVEKAQITPELAKDGIEEYFEVFAGRLLAKGAVPKHSLHLHGSDQEGAEWTINYDKDALAIARGHQKSDIALRGDTSLLLLWTWGRIKRDELEVLGSVEALTSWETFLRGI